LNVFLQLTVRYAVGKLVSWKMGERLAA